MSTWSERPFRRLGDAALVALFAAGIALPLMDRLLHPDSAQQARAEMRKPAPRPEPPRTWPELRAFPEAFEAYYGDSFGLRAELIRWHNVARMSAGATPSPQLVLGREGWLFTTREKSVEVWRGLDPFEPAELDVWREVLESRSAWCAERGIHYAIAVAPNKSTVYPERMPGGLQPVGPTRLDQLTEWMEAHSDLRILDLRGALLLAKRDATRREEEVYYPLGTHWNRFGMHAGYRAMLRWLRPVLPELAPRELGEFSIELSDHEGDNWGSRLYMEDRLHQTNVELVPRFEVRGRLLESQPDGLPVEVWGTGLADQPTAVLFHDSFGKMQRRLMAEHFRWIAFYYAPDFDADYLERVRPDVAMHLMVERALNVYRPATAPTDDSETLERVWGGARPLLRVDGARAPVEGEPPALEGEGGTRVEHGADGAGLALHTVEPNGRVLLPAFAVPDDAWPLLRLSIDSPVDTELALEFQTAKEPRYSMRSRQVRARLRAGPNEVLLRLLVPDLSGRLRLRPGVPPGVYRLRAFEVRTLPR